METFYSKYIAFLALSEKELFVRRIGKKIWSDTNGREIIAPVKMGALEIVQFVAL